MRTIGWIAGAIAGFFLLNSFTTKKDALPDASGLTTYNPPKKGTVNKDVSVEETNAPVSVPGQNALPFVGTKSYKKGTGIEIVSLFNGFYKVVTGANKTALIRVEDVDLVSENSLPASETNAARIVDTIVDPGSNSTSTSTSTSTNAPVTLPADEYTPYNPPKWAQCIHKTAIILNGWNQWIEQGAAVQVMGYKKHYAVISTGAIAFTELYDVTYNGQRGFVPTATMNINAGSPITSGNVEGYTGQEKYNPPLSGKTNKITKHYTSTTASSTLASGISVQISGKGIIRTNRINGTWNNYAVYDCTANGKRGAILVSDITLG